MEFNHHQQQAIKKAHIDGGTYLVGKPLANNAPTERRYVKKLEGIATAVTDLVSAEVHKYYKRPEVVQYFAMDSVAGDASELFVTLKMTIDKMTDRLAPEYAEEMLAAANSQSARASEEALRHLSDGLTLSSPTGKLLEIIEASVAENVLYIKSIPFDYLKNVEGHVMRSIAEPNSGGMKELIKNLDGMLDKQSKQIHNKAKNLALDQTRKAYNNLNAQRMQSAGIEEFIWRHSHAGQRPRDWHKNMLDGRVFAFNDLPVIDTKTGERGIPAQAINCKCYMVPVIKIAGETAPPPDPIAWHQ